MIQQVIVSFILMAWFPLLIIQDCLLHYPFSTHDSDDYRFAIKLKRSLWNNLLLSQMEQRWMKRRALFSNDRGLMVSATPARN